MSLLRVVEIGWLNTWGGGGAGKWRIWGIMKKSENWPGRTRGCREIENSGNYGENGEKGWANMGELRSVEFGEL